MSSMEKCLPIIRDVLQSKNRTPLNELLSKVHERIKVSKDPLRDAISECVKFGCVKILPAVRGERRRTYMWVAGARLPFIERKASRAKSHDEMRQTSRPSYLCKPVKVAFKPLDIVMHMWAALPTDTMVVNA